MWLGDALSAGRGVGSSHSGRCCPGHTSRHGESGGQDNDARTKTTTITEV